MEQPVRRTDPAEARYTGKGGHEGVSGSYVRDAYARWAPIYDLIATPTVPGRKRAAARVNAIGGHFLEAGVGSGSALPLYGPSVTITGVDLSHDMLVRAREKVATEPLAATIGGILEMDLMNLAFAADTFDGVICMFTITAVPEPKKAMAEFERVVKPGGLVLIASHFQATGGPWLITDRLLKPFSQRLGWNPSMSLAAVESGHGLTLERSENLPPLGLVQLLTFRKPT